MKSWTIRPISASHPASKAHQEFAVEIDLPKACVSNPIAFNDGDHFFCVYRIAPIQQARAGQISTSDVKKIAIIQSDSCWDMRFGYPNDDAISGHRLYDKGLSASTTVEVLNSSWIAGMEKANRVHHNHHADLFSDLRHFIIQFHDTMLEFIAKDLEVFTADGPERPLFKQIVSQTI